MPKTSIIIEITHGKKKQTSIKVSNRGENKFIEFANGVTIERDDVCELLRYMVNAKQLERNIAELFHYQKEQGYQCS